jgi:hypothetical protein
MPPSFLHQQTELVTMRPRTFNEGRRITAYLALRRAVLVDFGALGASDARRLSEYIDESRRFPGAVSFALSSTRILVLPCSSGEPFLPA